MLSLTVRPHRLESRMREIRPSGLEGGGAVTPLSLPLSDRGSMSRSMCVAVTVQMASEMVEIKQRSFWKRNSVYLVGKTLNSNSLISVLGNVRLCLRTRKVRQFREWSESLYRTATRFPSP